MNPTDIINFERYVTTKEEALEVATNIKAMFKEYADTLEREDTDDDEYMDIMEDAHLLELKAVIQAKRLTPEDYEKHGLHTLFGCPHKDLKTPDF